jgi:regulation of enolase protein 1 (concanavalin A-like superfamily)
VKIDNTVVGSYNPGSGATSYSDYTATFTATASTHTLAFVGTDLAGGDNTIFIDNVRLSIVPPSPPNFGFETPVISNFQYGPTGGSWTFNNNGANSNYSGIVANGSGFSNPNAPQGNQAAFVQDYGVVSQAISGFVPSRSYTITFSAAERGGVNQHGGQSWTVKMDSTVVGSYSPGTGATSYTDYTATFTATASTHTLAFVGTDLAGGDNTVFIDNVRITTVAAPLDGDAYLPPPLLSLDIGVTGPAGGADFNNGVFTVMGAGTGIGGTADSFRFLYQTASGDCTNTVRVAALDDTSPDAKAGVMIRESLNANARAVGVWVTPDGSIVYTSRSKTGGSSSVETLPGGTVPCWLRIARTGDTFQGYYSADGTTWTPFGSTKKIRMSTSAYIGMGVESGVADGLNTATIDSPAVIP